MSSYCLEKVFLDENIYCLEEPLRELGVDVDKLPQHLRKMSDEEAFEYAQKRQRAFITINGKHFVILVPPRRKRDGHFGLLWIRFQINRTMANAVAQGIYNFLNGNDVYGSVFVMKRSGDSFEFVKRVNNKGEYLIN